MDTISHPNGSRQHQIIGVASMLLFLSTAAVAFRLLIRRTTGLGLWWDDYTIVFALVRQCPNAFHCDMMADLSGITDPVMGVSNLQPRW